MKEIDGIISRASDSERGKDLAGALTSEGAVVALRGLAGSAYALYAAAALRRKGGIHVFVSEDKDSAAYLMNDFYALDRKSVV